MQPCNMKLKTVTLLTVQELFTCFYKSLTLSLRFWEILSDALMLENFAVRQMLIQVFIKIHAKFGGFYQQYQSVHMDRFKNFATETPVQDAAPVIL